MKNLRKDKNIRRALLCQRLLSAAAVLQYYEAYFRFVDCATLAKSGGISYSDAEDFSNFMGNVFGCDVDPSDYVSSEDTLSNEAIESYKDLQAVLDKYDDSGKRNISGTAKQLFYTKFYMRSYCDFFIDYLNRVLFYVNDSLINGEEGIIEDLRYGSVWFNLYDGTPRKMDTRLFRKALRDIDVVFNENIKKVTKRILKQEEVLTIKTNKK